MVDHRVQQQAAHTTSRAPLRKRTTLGVLARRRFSPRIFGRSIKASHTPLGRLSRLPRLRWRQAQLRRHIGTGRVEQYRPRCRVRQHRQHAARARGDRGHQPLQCSSGNRAGRTTLVRDRASVSNERTERKNQHTIQPVPAGTQAVSGSSLIVSLPALSVTTIDVY